jgi:hypothetical protein
MAVNLVSLIMQFVTPSLVSKMGGALGLDRDQTQKAVGVGIPAILAGLASAAAKPQNQQKLSDVMAQQSTALDQAKSAINDGRPGALSETGNNLLSSLLGGDTLNMVAGAVGRFAGIDPSTTKSLLGMLAPLAAGVIGQQQRSEGLNASGLANLLTSQSGQVMSAMPAGFASLLGNTGLLDGLGDSWRSGAAATAAMADRISDMPGQTAVSAGQLAQASARSASASHWPWVIAGLAVLAGLGWYVFSHDESQTLAERSLSPTTRVSETTGAGVPDQRLTDIAAELTSSVSVTRSALQGISDPVSAQAALPRLRQASAQFDNISNAISQLPPNARKGVSSVVTRSMPMLNQLFDRVLASPQTAQLTKPTIDALRAKLDALAKS